MLNILWCVLALLLALVSPSAHAGPAAIDANRGDQAALESVRGIGPAMSARIVAERRQALFKDWTDFVDRVKGVGEGNAARFSRGGLTVNGSPFMPASSGTGGSGAEKANAKATPGPGRPPASRASPGPPAKPPGPKDHLGRFGGQG